MVRFLRAEMLDQTGPTPSVEALMHAFLPQEVVDHTHSAAALALANQPDAAGIARAIYGDRLCVVPYVMPGFALSHAADGIFAAEGEGTEGMFLVNHGLFSFAGDARTSYENILRFTNECEAFLADNGAPLTGPEGDARVSWTPPEVVALAEALGAHAPFRENLAVDLRSSPAIDRYLALPDLAEISARGTVTPDHVIRIKPRPVIGAKGFARGDWDRALAAYADWYQAYFTRNAARATEPKTMLDPMPRVALIPGLGIAGFGRNAREAAIAADLAEQSARVIWSAERFGRFTPLAEADLFDMEYWSLEQAKLRAAG